VENPVEHDLVFLFHGMNCQKPEGGEEEISGQMAFFLNGFHFLRRDDALQRQKHPAGRPGGHIRNEIDAPVVFRIGGFKELPVFPVLFACPLLLLLIQVFLIISFYTWLKDLLPFFSVITVLFTIGGIIYLFNCDMDSSAKLTWMLVFSIAPLFRLPDSVSAASLATTIENESAGAFM
jgi:hypothetical protein